MRGGDVSYGPPAPRFNISVHSNMTYRETSATGEPALLAAIGQGDESAFLALYERFSGPLYSLLFKMLQSREDADEILQAVFLQVWKKATTYDSTRCAVFTWLVHITRSRAIDRLRQRQRQARTLDAATQEADPTVVSDDGNGATIFQHENAAAVRAALERIPAEQREAIEMAFFKGMSQTEISEAIAAPLGTVKARIRRGLLRLRDSLARRL
jgi:RNA polymerase sigma-70 factor (ECF subfamily)